MRFTYTKIITVGVALLTMCGLAIHDTKLDTMTKFAFALPVVMATYEGVGAMMHLGGDPHTHVESVSLRQGSQQHSLSLNPLLPPRPNEHKGHRLQKYVPKGHHPFDNYTLPLLG